MPVGGVGSTPHARWVVQKRQTGKLQICKKKKKCFFSERSELEFLYDFPFIKTDCGFKESRPQKKILADIYPVEEGVVPVSNYR